MSIGSASASGLKGPRFKSSSRHLGSLDEATVRFFFPGLVGLTMGEEYSFLCFLHKKKKKKKKKKERKVTKKNVINLNLMLEKKE
jgi:hypothetical protein